MIEVDKRVVSMGYKRCTSIKGNRRIIFPGGRNPKEEAAIDVRLNMWLDTVKS